LPLSDVWAVVGDHRRLPEYSAGIEHVEVTTAGDSRVCRFPDLATARASFDDGLADIGQRLVARFARTYRRAILGRPLKRVTDDSTTALR